MADFEAAIREKATSRSSSTMIPVAVLSAGRSTPVTPFDAPNNVNVNVSSTSTTSSLVIGTQIVPLVSPAGIVNVPFVPTYGTV